MPRLTPRTRDARRQQILGAAQRCFTRNGFQATSMQDIFAESGLSAGAVYSHFTGKDEIITAIAEDVIDKITSAVGAALPGDEPQALDEALDGFFATLQRLDIAPIAVIVWAEAIRDPALSQRLSGLYRGLADHFTKLVRIGQAGGSIDPGTPAEHTAVVLTALGPAFLHQLAFGPGIDAAAFTQGLRALMRG
jgi:TetR/AcrR family transcriptional regulator, transcriptional repressor of aconitase